MLIETSGPDSNVVKLMPAITMSPEDLDGGLDRLAACFDEVLS